MKSSPTWSWSLVAHRTTLHSILFICSVADVTRSVTGALLVRRTAARMPKLLQALLERRGLGLCGFRHSCFCRQPGGERRRSLIDAQCSRAQKQQRRKLKRTFAWRTVRRLQERETLLECFLSVSNSSDTFDVFLHAAATVATSTAPHVLAVG